MSNVETTIKTAVKAVDFEKQAQNSALTCIDLFAGCGGLSLGLELAGFKPLLFSEINKSAAETYIANRVDENIIPVGDIYNLTDTDLELLKLNWGYQGIKDIDLVCGGPPCQGYSGIGHRRTFNLEKHEIPSNHLYQEMIRVIKSVEPRIFVFENVKGLLSSRWTKEGKKGEVFNSVLNEFKKLSNYKIKWDLVYAKDYGVPQNRPRVLLVGIRNDVANSIDKIKNLDQNTDDPSAIDHGFLPEPSGTPPTLKELLSDLIDPSYIKNGVTEKYVHSPMNDHQRELRTTPEGRLSRKGAKLTEQEYSSHSEQIREKFQHMIKNNGEIPEEMKTKKFAQRVFPKTWDLKGPNITVTSLPEDYVHFSQPRSPTVREWARIQGFPDWYLFRGPRTTGGRRRAGDPDKGEWGRDVPKYTQIGNAVPVKLAHKVGLHLKELLSSK